MKQIYTLTETYRNAFLGERISISSGAMQRSVGDELEKLVEDFSLNTLTGFDAYPASSKRSIEDVKLTSDDITILVDVKTEDVDADFHMPNIISADRLRKTYTDPNTFVLYVFLKYRKSQSFNSVEVLGVECMLAEEMDWSSLSIGNLGKGQIQLKSHPTRTNIGREAWLVELHSNMRTFIEKQQVKLAKELDVWTC